MKSAQSVLRVAVASAFAVVGLVATAHAHMALIPVARSDAVHAHRAAHAALTAVAKSDAVRAQRAVHAAHHARHRVRRHRLALRASELLPDCTLPSDPAPARHGNSRDRQHSTLPVLAKTQRPPAGSRGGSRAFAACPGSGSLAVMEVLTLEPRQNQDRIDRAGEPMAARGPPRAGPRFLPAPTAAGRQSAPRALPLATASRIPTSTRFSPAATLLADCGSPAAQANRRFSAPRLHASRRGSAPDPTGPGAPDVRPGEGRPACLVTPSFGGS